MWDLLENYKTYKKELNDLKTVVNYYIKNNSLFATNGKEIFKLCSIDKIDTKGLEGRQFRFNIQKLFDCLTVIKKDRKFIGFEFLKEGISIFGTGLKYLVYANIVPVNHELEVFDTNTPIHAKIEDQLFLNLTKDLQKKAEDKGLKSFCEVNKGVLLVSTTEVGYLKNLEGSTADSEAIYKYKNIYLKPGTTSTIMSKAIKSLEGINYRFKISANRLLVDEIILKENTVQLINTSAAEGNSNFTLQIENTTHALVKLIVSDSFKQLMRKLGKREITIGICCGIDAKTTFVEITGDFDFKIITVLSKNNLT